MKTAFFFVAMLGLVLGICAYSYAGGTCPSCQSSVSWDSKECDYGTAKGCYKCCPVGQQASGTDSGCDHNGLPQDATCLCS